MASPKVTVLMPVCNGERYLGKAVDSILSQTFKDFEFLIVNDGSTDRTMEILKGYEDPRIKVISNGKNIGLTKSLNKALRKAKGEYIARMDADDISESNRLERQAEFLEEQPLVGVLGINSWIIGEKGESLGKTQYATANRGIMARMLGENQMVHSSLMARKELLERLGGYEEKLALAQDYELILRLSNAAKLANLPEPLHQWRINSPGGITKTKREAQKRARDGIRKAFLEKHYSQNQGFRDLVLENWMNNSADRILLEYRDKILANQPFMTRLLIKTRMAAHLLAKRAKRKVLKNGI